MAYVNVEEWSSDEVSNWMKGLEPCLSAYVNQLWEAGVSGKQLLQLAPDMLPRLGIHKIGHQELLLQAIAQLRNIHYQLDKETLQQLALRLSSRARSVYSELRQQGSSLDSDTSCNGREDDYKNSDEDENSRNENNKKASQKKSRLVSTATVAAVADCLAAVKTVVSWLNRTPFDGLAKYDKRLEELTELGIRLATISQRDQFAENQAIAIMDNCRELTKIADDIIQNDCNPLIIQPASLVVATIKKKHDDDLGVHLITTYDGVHQVSIIRPLTPAHTCGKLSLGDQLIQVNYDTVIGWTPEKVMKALSENPVEVILTVKKQPRHAPGAQQIYSYFKPFRLPSKKRSYNHGYSGQHEYSYRNNFSNNLNIYSLLDQAGSRQIFSTLPKAAPLASPDQPLQTGVPALRPVSPEHAAAAAAAAPTLGVGSPGAAREGRQSSVSFAVTEAPSNADASSSFGVSVPSSSPHLPLIPSSVHNASDSCIRLNQEDDDDDDDPFLSSDDDLTAHQDGEDDAASTSGASVRLYPPKPRAPVHRRATIPGDTAPPLTAATTLNQYIEGLRQSGLVLRLGGRVSTGDQKDPMIRSTAGQETRARPHTIGAGKLLRDGAAGDQASQDASEDRFVSGQPRVGPVSLPAKVSSTASVVDRDAPATKPQLSLSSVSGGGDDGAIVGPSPPTVFDTPLPFTITSPPTPLTPNPPSTPHTPGGRRVSEDRPRLDKSHSTPAYDFGSESAPNSTTAVSGPSSTALLVPGSAPAASSGGHRNLLLPGAESNAKVQAGTSQKKHLPGVCGGGRGISCRELGAGDHQGWLYRRSKGSRHFLQQHTWEKRWFILKKGYLYGYSGEDALKAESLIYLPGFHVCPAQDAKTKKFAFKIYHANGATFYFACDTSEERSRWMSEMGLSALSSGRCGGDASGPSSPAAVGPTAAASPASSSSCSSPTLLPQHLEEAYYSETDDELDDSSLSTSAFPTTEEGSERYVPMAAAVASTTTAALTTTASTSSSNAFSSLFHWGSGGKSSSSATAGTAGVTSYVGSGRTSALSSFLKPKQIQAVPSANFRSYRRVREPGRSTSTSDLRQPGLCEAPPLTPTTPKPVSQQAAPTKANAVARKGSLREKLRSHLPSALTLDRRRKAPDSAQNKKRGKMDSKTFPVEVSRDKSDSTLSSSSQEKILEESTNMENASELSSQQEESSISLGRAQVSLESGGRMESNEAEFDASVSCEDKGNTPRSSSSVLNDSKMQPVTPLKCKLIDASLKGSLDCLSSTASPYGTHCRTVADGSQKMWISTLRSPSTQPGESITGPFKIKNRPSPLPRHHSSSGTSSSHFSSNPNSPKSPTDGFGFSTSLTDTGGSSCSLSHTSSLIEHRSTGEQRPSSVERLKRTGNYKPVILKSKEPMRAAFVMGLDHDAETSQGKHSALTSTPNSSQFSLSTLGSSVRPQVPPRTKFLSPSERIAQRRSDVSLGASSSSASFSREDSMYNTALSPSSTSAASILESSLIFSPISAYKNPLSAATSSTLENRPRGGLSSRLEVAQLPTDDQEQPKTPLKPTMGVCMIGKQRRTPGVLSPREVFFCSPPPSPSATTSPALTTSGSVSSSFSQHHYLPNTTLASTSHNPTPTNPPSRPLSGGRQPASSTPIGHASSAPAGRHAAGSRTAGRPPSGSSSVGRYSKHHAEVASGDKGDSTTSDDCSNVNRSVRVASYTGPDGKPLMVLPHYPDMEYPPTFEAGSYTIPGFTEPSTPCSHPPCTSYSSSQPFTASSVSSSTQQTSQNSRSHPYTPSYTPRTPRSPTLYYNLQGFNSASLPSLPSQDTEPPSSATQRPHQSSSKLYSDDVSSASSLPSANLPLSQRPQMPLPHSGGTSLSVSGGLSLHIPAQPQSSPQVSPHSSGSPRVIVGISCSGSDCVVSHHHSIYVTSPVKPSKTPSSHDDVTSCVATGAPSYVETQRPKRVQSSADVVSPTSTRESIQKQSRRRTPPGSFTTSQSNSSLDSISEHASIQRPGNASIHLSGNGSSSSRSGGCATVFDPLKKSDSVEATREGVNFGNFQFGGSSGGTVITASGSGGHYSCSISSPKTSESQVQNDILRSSSKDSLNSSTSPGASGRPKLDPPRLVLPGPPSDPPPDD